MAEQPLEDAIFEGRDELADVDRMLNEGLGAGRMTTQNAAQTESATDAMEADEP